MCHVNKTHSGQFTLSTSQRKDKWAEKKTTKTTKTTRGVGGVGVRFPPLSLSLFSSFFPSSIPSRHTPPAERLEQVSLLLCDISSPLFQNIQAKGKGGTLFSWKDTSHKTLIESKGTTVKWINLSPS